MGEMTAEMRAWASTTVQSIWPEDPPVGSVRSLRMRRRFLDYLHAPDCHIGGVLVRATALNQALPRDPVFRSTQEKLDVFHEELLTRLHGRPTGHMELPAQRLWSKLQAPLKCPKCRGMGDPVVENTDYGRTRILVTVKCRACKRQWAEVYKMVRLEGFTILGQPLDGEAQTAESAAGDATDD